MLGQWNDTKIENGAIELIRKLRNWPIWEAGLENRVTINRKYMGLLLGTSGCPYGKPTKLESYFKTYKEISSNRLKINGNIGESSLTGGLEKHLM